MPVLAIIKRKQMIWNNKYTTMKMWQMFCLKLCLCVNNGNKNTFSLLSNNKHTLHEVAYPYRKETTDNIF